MAAERTGGGVASLKGMVCADLAAPGAGGGAKTAAPMTRPTPAPDTAPTVSARARSRVCTNKDNDFVSLATRAQCAPHHRRSSPPLQLAGPWLKAQSSRYTDGRRIELEAKFVPRLWPSCNPLPRRSMNPQRKAPRIRASNLLPSPLRTGFGGGGLPGTDAVSARPALIALRQDGAPHP